MCRDGCRRERQFGHAQNCWRRELQLPGFLRGAVFGFHAGDCDRFACASCARVSVVDSAYVCSRPAASRASSGRWCSNVFRVSLTSPLGGAPGVHVDNPAPGFITRCRFISSVHNELGTRRKHEHCHRRIPGIGRAIADRFAKAGSDLVICSRDQDAIQEVAAELRDTYDVGAVGVGRTAYSTAGSGVFGFFQARRHAVRLPRNPVERCRACDHRN